MTQMLNITIILTLSIWGCGAEGARFLGMEEVGGSIPPSSTRNINGSGVFDLSRFLSLAAKNFKLFCAGREFYPSENPKQLRKS